MATNSNSTSGIAMDIARYTAIDSDELTRLHPAMVRALRERFPGLIDARLAQTADGSCIDIITWDSIEAAERARAGEPEVPQYVSFTRHIDKVLWSECIPVASDSGQIARENPVPASTERM